MRLLAAVRCLLKHRQYWEKALGYKRALGLNGDYYQTWHCHACKRAWRRYTA